MAEAGAQRTGPASLGEVTLRRLHRRAISDRSAVTDLLRAVQACGVTLRNGVNRRNAERVARVAWVSDDTLGLVVQNISSKQPQLFLNFQINGTSYFFATRVRHAEDGVLITGMPSSIFEAERRDLRRTPASVLANPEYVEVKADATGPRIARLRDWSYDGIGVALPCDQSYERGAVVSVRFVDGARAGTLASGVVRNVAPDSEIEGWTRLGLYVSAVPSATRVQAETRDRILVQGRPARAWRRIVLAGGPARIARQRIARRLGLVSSPRVPVVHFENDLGQRLVGILDRTHEQCKTAVLIPPSWGRTKETFLPLARTIQRTFISAGESVGVLRFDGTNRRGESYVDPRFRSQGEEYLGFRFSQAVKDIQSGVEFLARTLAPEHVVLVTFSLASIEGRRAVATDRSGLIKGWVSVVGMPDLQSGLRAVSGGVDYAQGLLESVEFGCHELVGVLADMDSTGLDALHNRLVFLEDARRDMAQVAVPVTWLHGRHDGWIELDRISRLLSSGETANRRLIEIPTGHELRSSAEALETFQFIGVEAARIALGREVEAVLPEIAELEATRESERKRRPAPVLNADRFWRDYLLGRQGNGGMELLVASSSYRAFMQDQIEAIQLRQNWHVLDLGSGLGEFARLLAISCPASVNCRVTEIDLIPEVLRRSQARAIDQSTSRTNIRRVAADLSSGRIPLRSCSANAALASLVISYIQDDVRFLREIIRVLIPGGRLVISTMRRDADISQIYVDSAAELETVSVGGKNSSEPGVELDALQREFLNSASRLIDLEETGRFRFYDSDELHSMLRHAGFVDVVVSPSFGDPMQAYIAVCRRP